MSIPRHPTLRSLSIRYSAGQSIEWHTHEWTQLIYATQGVMTVSLPGGRWVVPTRQAILVNAMTRHRIDMHGSVFLQTVYFQRPTTCPNNIVVEISSLMHELIRHVCAKGIVHPKSRADRTLIRFFYQQLEEMKAIDLELRLPQDERALGFANLLLQDPASTESLAEIARRCGSSLRTIQRLFPAEVGLTVSQWRRRVRMTRAIEHLANGGSVTGVALELGFDSVSAFIQAFREYFGVTPGKYRTS